MSRRDRTAGPIIRNSRARSTARRHRRRRITAAVLALALVGGFALSTIRGEVPAGVISSRTELGTDEDSLLVRDIEGRRFELPGRHEGAVMFMTPRGCPGCIEAAKELVAGGARSRPRPAITIVSIDPEASRDDFESFDKEAGGLTARYALDDASGTIASFFGGGGPGTVVAYGPQGLVTGRFEPGPEQLAGLQGAFDSN